MNKKTSDKRKTEKKITGLPDEIKEVKRINVTNPDSRMMKGNQDSHY